MRLGQLRLEAGRHAEAEHEFRRALALHPEDPDATSGLAVTYEKMGRATDAERLYLKALTLRPGHAATFNLYAVFLFYAGRYQEAAANFRRFTELMPTARGFANLAAAYQALGAYEDAERANERSIALEPTTDGYLGLGLVYYYTGRYADARLTLQKAVALSPTNYDAWVSLGDAYRWSPGMRDKSTEAYKKAVDAAREALAVNPRDALAHAVSAISLAKLGRSNEATAESNAAVKIDPTNKATLYAAAVEAHLRGASDAAVTWLERAVQAGYSVSDLQRDPELKSMQDDPAFRRVLQHHK
jgi:Flp pilus assembly protein TadD